LIFINYRLAKKIITGYTGREYIVLSDFMTLQQKNIPLSEKGQDLAEYAVFLGLIALVVLASVTVIGNGIANVFNAIAAAIQGGIF
jgi:pilus assembly protein Flp/PilA